MPKYAYATFGGASLKAAKMACLALEVLTLGKSGRFHLESLDLILPPTSFWSSHRRLIAVFWR